MLKHYPEILAPVGSEEALIAAVRSGADAVYFGTGECNARRFAEKFEKIDVLEIVHENICRIFCLLQIAFTVCIRIFSIELANFLF